MSVQKYRVFQSRLIAIDEYSAFNKDCHSVVVTHADYRALEDENGRLKDKLADYEDLCTERNTEIQHLREELASIKARIESMQDRIDAYQEKGLIQ